MNLCVAHTWLSWVLTLLERALGKEGWLWKTVDRRVRSLHPGCLFPSNRVTRGMLFQATLLMVETGRPTSSVLVKSMANRRWCSKDQKKALGWRLKRQKWELGHQLTGLGAKHTQRQVHWKGCCDKRWRLKFEESRGRGRKCIVVESREASEGWEGCCKCKRLIKLQSKAERKSSQAHAIP